MAGETKDQIWPLPKFYFTVRFGSTVAKFQEVSGLETDTPMIDHRQGNSLGFAPIKLPGLQRTGNVIMHKGIFADHSELWDWFSQIEMDTTKRQDVVISLLDETGAPKMVWTLTNAWPTKVTGTDLKSEGREVAIESIELAFEAISLAAP